MSEAAAAGTDLHALRHASSRIDDIECLRAFAIRRLPLSAMGSRWLRYPVLLLLLGTIAWLAASNDSASLNWRVGAIGALAAVLARLASYGQGSICEDSWLESTLLWIGSRSYAIYLIHIPAYCFVRECFWRMDMAATPPPPYSSFIYAASAMLLIGLLAEATFRWIDILLRDRGQRLAHRIQQRPSGTPQRGVRPAHPLSL